LKYNTGKDPEEFKGFHGTPFTSDRPLTSLDKLLKMLGKLKSVYYHTIRRQSLSLLCTGNYIILHWSQWVPDSFFILCTNTDDFGGFLQVQHYWWVNICCKILNLGLWKLWMRNWSHQVPTTKLTTFVVSKDTKEGTGKSIKIALYVQEHGKRHLLGWSDTEQRKIKPVALATVELCESEGIS